MYLKLAASSQQNVANKCHKAGHIAKACMTAGSSKQTRQGQHNEQSSNQKKQPNKTVTSTYLYQKFRSVRSC